MTKTNSTTTVVIVRIAFKTLASGGGKIFATLVLAPLLLVAVLFFAIGSASTQPATAAPSASGQQPSEYAKQLIPADMLALYQSPTVKKECPGLSWTVVAAIIHLESDDNRNPGLSSAGAMGASQFMPTTWDSQGRLVIRVGPYGRDPNGQGYALDGDGDGIADIMNPKDSVPATARLLCANGGGNPATLPKAVFAYNHADWYVNGGTDDSGNQFIGVLPLANRLGSIIPAQSNTTVEVAVQAALTQVGKPYTWGGEGALGPNGSGLVRWAYSKAGIMLPATPDKQMHSKLGVPVGAGDLQRGDLVSWGTRNGSGIHASRIGIYLDNNQVITAPQPGQQNVQASSMYFKGFVGGFRLQGSSGTSDSWQLPIDKSSYILTSWFGECGPLWANCHTGQDFAADLGTPIRAVSSGVIVSAEWAGPYGFRTIIRSPDGTEAWYCHQSSLVLTSGTVSAGTVIGLVGNTGNVTGYHLHLEIHPGGGAAVDPLSFLRSKGLNP